ncbi:Flotillin-2, partial [Cichlidogyrus casuarinus]
DRDQFAALVREVASPDVGRMGVEVLSFTIKDVYDEVEYLDSLGRGQTAIVKRDADIGVAVAEKEAGIMEAECEKLRKDAHYQANTLVASSTRDYEKKQSEFNQEVNKAKAESELAYKLQEAKEQQKVRAEEIQIEIVERRKQIELEEQEILCNEKKLDAEVKQPAEAEAFRLQQMAEGQRVVTVCKAQGEADTIRLKGLAQAYVIEQRGLAEAERMALRADAYQKYGDVAMLNLVLDTLPKIAAKVSAPLSKVDEIVLLSGNQGGLDASTLAKLGQDFTTLVGNVPPAVRAMTGIDLSQTFAKIPGATTSA